MAKNTTKSVNQPNVSDADLNKEIDGALKKFKDEKTVKVSIPKVLQSQLGQTLYVGVNGVYVNLPVDGSTHEIPETLANHLKDYLANLN